MAERSDAPTKTAERELVITRLFDARRELVWKAWTERECVMRWLGPKEFTALDFEMERRPGGAWHSRMRSPEGTVHSNRGVVREVVEPSRFHVRLGRRGWQARPRNADHDHVRRT